MVQIDVTYEGSLRCRAVHGPSGQSLLTDAPVDNHGKGETFSPTDLVATATASCMLTIVGIVAAREGIDVAGAGASVVKHMSVDGPRRIGRLQIVLRLPSALTPDERRHLEAAARGCPVARSLHPDTAVELAFEYAA